MIRVADYSWFMFWLMQFLLFVSIQLTAVLCFMSLYYGLGSRNIPLYGFVGAVSFFIIQTVTGLLKFYGGKAAPDRVILFFEQLPGYIPAVVTAVLLAADIVMVKDAFKKTGGRVMRGSIKEAVDELPKGICIFQPGGRVRLSNRAFENLVFSVFGEALKNGEEVWQGFMAGKGSAEYLESGAKPVMRLCDGTVVMLERKELRLGSLDFIQLTLTDYTVSYVKTENLKEKKQQLEDMNLRLRHYSLRAEALAAEKETLATKIRVHDTLGEQLLAVKRYLKSGDGDPVALASGLSGAVTIFKEPSDIIEEQGRDEPDEIIAIAGMLGVEVIINGDMPEDERTKRLIAAALSECLTNTIRHAGGDRLVLDIADTGSALQCRITNNGRDPEGPVTEKGGLRLLRAMAENMGCAMALEYSPAFALLLRIPVQ